MKKECRLTETPVDQPMFSVNKPRRLNSARMIVLMSYCEDCGRDLSDVGDGDPCPKCGGLRRGCEVEPITAVVSVDALTPGTVVGSTSGHRPWQQKWCQVLRSLDDVRKVYDGTASDKGSETAVSAVNDFFQECGHLGE